jgi:hypothetical protein
MPGRTAVRPGRERAGRSPEVAKAAEPIGSAGGQRADRHAAGVGRSPERGSASHSPRTHHGAVVSTAAQRTFNPQGAGANPAGSTMNHPQSMRADVRRNLPAPSDLNCGLTRRARAAKGPACKAEARGCKSRRRVHFWGCGAKSSTPRPQRGGDGALPSNSTSFAREVLIDALLSSKQREPARYRPRAPYGADVQGDGLVSKTDRQGAIPWRRANFPPVAQTAEQATDNRQRPVQVRTGGPFYSAAWTKAHTRQTISGVSVKRAADPFGGQADLVMARA